MLSVVHALLMHNAWFVLDFAKYLFKLFSMIWMYQMDASQADYYYYNIEFPCSSKLNMEFNIRALLWVSWGGA